MYLGTITSVMTKNLQEKLEFEISGKKVNMLAGDNFDGLYISRKSLVLYVILWIIMELLDKFFWK